MSLVARRVAELIEPEAFDAMLDRIHDEHDGDGIAARLAMLEALDDVPEINVLIDTGRWRYDDVSILPYGKESAGPRWHQIPLFGNLRAPVRFCFLRTIDDCIQWLFVWEIVEGCCWLIRYTARWRVVCWSEANPAEAPAASRT